MAYRIKTQIFGCIIFLALCVCQSAYSQSIKSSYYVLNPEFETQEINVISLSDDNKIEAGTLVLKLDRYDVGTIDRSAGVALGSEIKGSGPFVIGSESDKTDIPVPAWFQGTQFVVPHVRYENYFSLLSIGDDANVTINRAGVQEDLFLTKGIVTLFNGGSDNSISSILTSDRPILMMHYNHRNGAMYGDVYPVPPAAKEVWGIRSKNVLIGAAEDATSLTVYTSGGASQSYVLNAGGRLLLGIGANTSEGRGEAIHVVADKLIAAVQYGDGDGGEATAFWPHTYVGNRYGLPVNTQYISVACPEPDTQVTLYDGSGAPVSKDCSGSLDSFPGKAYFGSSTDGVNINAGAHIESTKPIYAYHEASASDDEHQITSHENSYYILDPWLQEQALAIVSLEDGNIISAGNANISVDEYEVSSIPAGQDIGPGKKIYGRKPFDIGNIVDGSDIPVPSSFLGLKFAIPHVRANHKYDLLSPQGDAEVRIDLNGATHTLALPEGVVISFDAGNDNSVVGLVSATVPILTYHRAELGSAPAIRHDTYPVAPLANELWGIRSQHVQLAAFQDDTSISVYADNGQTENIILNAGESHTVVIGNQLTQGRGAALHIVSDKPISGIRYDDGDGDEITGLWPIEFRGNKYAIPVAAQYVSVICIRPDTTVILVKTDNSKVIKTCSADGNFPDKVFFGTEVNTLNISAGSYVESDEAIFVYYENSDTNDEKGLLGAMVQPSLPPTAVVTVDVEQGDRPLTVQFDATSSSSNSGSPILSYDWDFKDGNIGNGVTVNHTYLASGTYIATLTVSTQEGETDQVSQQILVEGDELNLPPNVDVGADQSIDEGNSAILVGSVSDDGLPGVPYALTTNWSIVSGPGSANFVDNQAVDTTVTFSAIGQYVLRLTANDGEFSTSDELLITVSPVVNAAPTVAAIAELTIEEGSLASLSGSVSDDGLPGTPLSLTTTWSLVSGPGSANFADSQSINTTVGFTTIGVYVLRLTADDGMLSTSDDVNVTVTPLPIALTFDVGTLNNVTDVWRTISLSNSYTSMVVIASPVLPAKGDIPVTTRVRNASGDSFEIKLQDPSGRPVSGYDVHYFVVDEGVYNEVQHGIKMEAVKVLSSQTANKNDWNSLEARSFSNAYTTPVVVGQVLTENDPNWSVFWASSQTNRAHPPSASSFAAGKHVAADSILSRADEMIAYVVVESGNASISDMNVYAALTPDAIRSSDNSATGYTTPVVGLSNPGVAIVSSAAMDGQDGGWAVLFGADAVNPTQVTLVVDEDQLEDSERKHTTEQVALIVFDVAANRAPTADISASPDLGLAPLEVNFDAIGSSDSDGSIANYDWSFGDGELANGVNTVHSYNSPGAYETALTVTDNSGAYSIATTIITVNNRPPVAYFTANPGTGRAPLDIAFDASGSSDSDGSIVSYNWDFGDGNVNSGVNVDHTYLNEGLYSPTLTVTDNSGDTHSYALDIEVAPPTDALLSVDISVLNDNPYSFAGESLNYQYVVSNPGPVTVDNINIGDSQAVGISCPNDVLLSTEIMTCTGGYLVSQNDIDTGSVINSVTATGTDPEAIAVRSTDTTTASAIQSPAMTLVVQIFGGDNYDSVGDYVQYRYIVENTGNITLRFLSLTDDTVNSVVCTDLDLAPNEQVTCTGNYQVTLHNLNDGNIVNTARAEALPKGGNLVFPSDSASVNALQQPVLKLDHYTASGAPYTGEAEEILYLYSLYNGGNISLKAPFSINDDTVNATDITCPVDAVAVGNGDTYLDPGEKLSCSGTYIVQLSDVSSGMVLNSATASTLDINDNTIISNSDLEQASLSTSSVQAPVITSANDNVISSTFNVTGTAIPESNVRLYVRGIYQQSVRAGLDGAWQAAVYLAEGTNTIRATVWDSFESHLSNEISIIHAQEPPTGEAYQSSEIPQTGDKTVFHPYDDADINAGIARSYTRDDANETVTDDATGLIWQDNVDAKELEQSWSNASYYCSMSTHAGITDWRLPSNLELAYLVDHKRLAIGSSAPLISSAFENTYQSDDASVFYSYWTNQRYGAGGDYTQATFIDFRDGELFRDNLGDLHHVRCVSGAGEYGTSFQQKNTTVIDASNGLMWQDDIALVNNRIDWSSALSYCNNLQLQGSTDWRVPNINEGHSIVNELFRKEASSSAFKHRHDPGATNVDWWTSSTNGKSLNYWGGVDAGYADQAWTLKAYKYIFNGYFIRSNFSQNLSSKTFPNYVRCVRDFSYPVAHIGVASRNVMEGELVTFDASGSFAPDGGTITGYEWFTWDSAEMLSREVTFSKRDLAPGEHSILLKVTDNHGVEHVDFTVITVLADNLAPTAVAGFDQTAYEGDTVTLDGAASGDSDGTIIAYEWKEGEILLSQYQSFSKSDFTLGDHIITLTVTDNDGATSTDMVTVSIIADPNVPPVANAGPDQSVTIGSVVNFDGAASSDSDGTIIAYEWKESATLLSQVQSFAENDFALGDHVITLTVTDDDGATDSDDTLVTVSLPPNVLPVANAGEDQYTLIGDSVTLDGTASSDHDGTIENYQWTQIAGSTVVLNTAGNPIANFVMPDVLVGEPLTFQLEVTDDRGDTATDLIVITANTAPIAYAGDDRRVNMGETVTLSGFAYDKDGTIETYTWAQLGGTPITLNNPTAPTPSFTMPLLQPNDEALLFELTVSDDRGATMTDTVSIGRIKEVTLITNTYSGIAPLNVTFVVETDFDQPINNYGMSYDVDGTHSGLLDITSTDPDVFSHTYDTEGIYYPYVFMKDKQGNDYFDQITLEVVSKTNTEAEIKAQWDAMVAELISGNIESALTYFDEIKHDQYRQVFNAMDSNQIGEIFTGVNDFKLTSLNDHIAECVAVRTESDGGYGYPVRFVKHTNGLWRITSL